MPIYEYRCADCRAVFEKLRPMSQANAPTTCSQCGSSDASRAISLFSAVSRGGNGESRRIAGSSSCGSCAGGNCSTCSH